MTYFSVFIIACIVSLLAVVTTAHTDYLPVALRGGDGHTNGVGYRHPPRIPCPWGYAPRVYMPDYACRKEELLLASGRRQVRLFADGDGDDEGPKDFLKSSYVGTISIGNPPQVIVV